MRVVPNAGIQHVLQVDKQQIDCHRPPHSPVPSSPSTHMGAEGDQVPIASPSHHGRIGCEVPVLVSVQPRGRFATARCWTPRPPRARASRRGPKRDLAAGREAGLSRWRDRPTFQSQGLGRPEWSYAPRPRLRFPRPVMDELVRSLGLGGLSARDPGVIADLLLSDDPRPSSAD